MKHSMDPVIDLHVHVHAEPATPPWARTPYTPTMLRLDMDQAGVAHAALVTPLFGGDDNAYELDARAAAPSTFTVFGRVSIAAEGLPRELDRLQAAGAAGIRVHVPHARRHGASVPAIVATVSRAGARGLAASVYGADLALLRALATASTAPVIIDHLGLPAADEPDVADGLTTARDALEELVEHEHVLLKVSAVPLLVERHGLETVAAVLTAGLEAWTPDRLVFGSDHPRAARVLPYSTHVGQVRQLLIDLGGPGAARAVMHDTAQRLLATLHAPDRTVTP